MFFLRNLKRFITLLIVRFKNNKKKVYIHNSCIISGKNTYFEGHNVINKHTYFRGCLGYGTYIGPYCNINASIGKYCSIASNVKTINGQHPTNKYVSTHPAFYSLEKQAGFTYAKNSLFDEMRYADDKGHAVVIGNDVWIGEQVLILSGVHIGDGAIIGAGSLVTKDVPKYTIVGGVPAKKIRMRFTDYEISRLSEIKWWDRPVDWIEQNYYSFQDINQFIIQFDHKKTY